MVGAELILGTSISGDSTTMIAPVSRTRTLDEVRSTLAAIASVAKSPSLVGSAVCVVDCMQPHKEHYYQKLTAEFGVRAVLYGGRSSVKTALTRAVLGTPALLFLERIESLPELALHVGEQALSGVYVVQAETFGAGLEGLGYSDIREAVLADPTHLMYQVDEDAAGEDGRVLEILSAGPACPHPLRDAVGSLVKS